MAVALLMPTKYRTQILALERTSIKNVFDRCCARLNTEIISPEDSISYDEVMRRALGGDEPETLP